VVVGIWCGCGQLAAPPGGDLKEAAQGADRIHFGSCGGGGGVDIWWGGLR